MRRISIAFDEEAKASRDFWIVRRSRISSEECCCLWFGEDMTCFYVWTWKVRGHLGWWERKRLRHRFEEIPPTLSFDFYLHLAFD